ncbi:MAG: purine-binding chemotaxis protein CheW [candidate division NC10 bacterium]|nr:purine-binding chemotaxis protein CheW [candidate division NC10 bacterium]
MAQSLNWQQAYARLERARRALEAGGDLSPEEVRRILRDRAVALARPLEEAPTPAEVLELLLFSLGGGRYAVETAHVLEAVPLRELTPVPCTPPVILGVINHRGRILPVLDFRRLFESAGQGVTEGSRVVVVETGGMTSGIYADAVAGTVRIAAHELAPPPAGPAGGRQGFIRGVTGDMVAVLDVQALGQDPRIVVNEEVA